MLKQPENVKSFNTESFRHGTESNKIRNTKKVLQITGLNNFQGGRWDSNPRHPEPQSGALTY